MLITVDVWESEAERVMGSLAGVRDLDGDPVEVGFHDPYPVAGADEPRGTLVVSFCGQAFPELLEKVVKALIKGELKEEEV